MIRAGLYARVSKEEQAKGFSIEGQLDRARCHAGGEKWDVYEEYVDAGYSARTDERSAFKRMIADAKSGKLDVIVVLKGDRFARNRAHASMYKQLLKGLGVRVVSITEPVEEGTPAAVILEGMNEVIAEWYSVDLSVKVSDAKKRRAEKGLWNGPVPFGYLVGDDGNLVISEDEAELVRQTYSRYAAGGETDLSIAAWLNRTDFRPRVHLRSRKARVSLWSKDTVGGMLTNVFYLGLVKYKGKLLPGKHPAVVEQDIFDQVQAVRRQHRRGPSTYARRHRTYLLSGLVRSVHCGEKLSAHHISGHDYYQDTCKRRGLPCDHRGAYLRGDLIEEQVSMIVSTLTLPRS